MHSWKIHRKWVNGFFQVLKVTMCVYQHLQTDSGFYSCADGCLMICVATNHLSYCSPRNSKNNHKKKSTYAYLFLAMTAINHLWHKFLKYLSSTSFRYVEKSGIKGPFFLYKIKFCIDRFPTPPKKNRDNEIWYSLFEKSSPF